MSEPTRLLMIDDDPDFVEGIRSILEGAGYEVDVAYNPDDGFQALESNPPDLLLLDIMMGRGAEGVMIARKIRKDPEQHPLRTKLLDAELLPYQLDGIAFAIGAGLAAAAGIRADVCDVVVGDLAGVRRVLVAPYDDAVVAGVADVIVGDVEACKCVAGNNRRVSDVFEATAFDALTAAGAQFGPDPGALSGHEWFPLHDGAFEQ